LAVDACDFAIFETISFVIADHGWQCLWQPRHRPELWKDEANDAELHAGLWDGGQLDEREQRSLKEFSARLAAHSAPVVALLDFPRPEHLDVARSCGAAALMGKPYGAGCLLGELSRLVNSSGPLSSTERAGER
jgi:hypothetical protein